MENEQLKQFIEKVVKDQLDAMSNMVIPFHTHNSWDNPQLDPKIALLGFPVDQVADASVAPTDVPLNGQFRFQVDTTPIYYFWAYITYSTAGSLTGAWKGVALT